MMHEDLAVIGKLMLVIMIMVSYIMYRDYSGTIKSEDSSIEELIY